MPNLTEQQKLFLIGKYKLNQFAEIEKSRELTATESDEKNFIKEQLFGSVVRFGMSEARRRMSKYQIDSDAYTEVQQELAVMFFDMLPKYDPLQTTPTTYYVRYFNQVISEYLLEYSQHLTQYDAHNVTKVRGAIHYFESKGIQWDEPMIVTKTGLSPKVVKNTLNIAANSMRANIDDAINLSSKLPTPEEEYLKNEKTEIIMKSLEESLTKEELDFFLFRMNLDGDKELSYQVVADSLGMQVRDVKKKWSAIIAKLNNNKSLQAYSRKTTKVADSRLNMHDKAGEITENQILDFFGESN
jgi:hypothetical protein